MGSRIAGAEVNAADIDKETCLHYASAAGQTSAVELLLKNGEHSDCY